jgi:hypothetical protein
MIDTIRFKIEVSPEVFSKIQSNSRQRFEINKDTKILELQIFTKDIEIGSYDYHINIIATKHITDTIFLEFSIPKVFYGHNVYLFYPPIDNILKLVHKAIIDTFGVDFPSYETWIIQRLDICYAWRFNTQEDAYLAFLTLNSFTYPRKNKVAYDTSFEEKGISFDFKGYLKFEEFQKHDFKRFLKMKRMDLAYDFRELARNVFRIELSMRKKKLQTYFKKKKLTYKDINDTELLQNILREHFSSYTKRIDPKVMLENKILARLFSCYKASKALNLYSFYQSWNHPKPSIRKQNRSAYKKRLNPSSLWRKHHDLALAGVGIIADKYFSFDFSIPSPQVVNAENISVALATENV